MKRIYSKPWIVPVDITPESVILTGSVTTTSLTVNTVEVQAYENGFESQPGGLQLLDFD